MARKGWEPSDPLGAQRLEPGELLIMGLNSPSLTVVDSFMYIVYSIYGEHSKLSYSTASSKFRLLFNTTLVIVLEEFDYYLEQSG